MIQVSGHISLKCRINDLTLVAISTIQPEHVAAIVKTGLTYVGRRLTQDLAYVLYHSCVFGVMRFSE